MNIKEKSAAANSPKGTWLALVALPCAFLDTLESALFSLIFYNNPTLINRSCVRFKSANVDKSTAGDLIAERAGKSSGVRDGFTIEYS